MGYNYINIQGANIKMTSWLIESFLNLAQAISSYISQGIETLIDCLFYPVQRVFYWFSAIVDIIINAVTGIITSLWSLYDILYNFLYSVFVGVFPYTLTILIFTGLTIVFLFRIYHFVKGISIAGFKLG